MKTQAKIQILAHIFQFKINKVTDEGLQYPNKEGFMGGIFSGGENVPIGTLVTLFCAPNTKYYLSWLKEIKMEGGEAKFLLESIEDGEVCWWSNVSLYYLPLEYVERFPDWKWTDKQFEFAKKWYRVKSSYMVVPMQPVFLENGNVILKVRYKFNLKEDQPEKEFSNWKTLTKREMQIFIDSLNV